MLLIYNKDNKVQMDIQSLVSFIDYLKLKINIRENWFFVSWLNGIKFMIHNKQNNNV